MADQAETLRQLMRERSEFDASVEAPKVFSFAGARLSVGASTILANLSSILARSGWSVAVVGADQGGTASAFGAEPSAQDMPVQLLEQDLWLVTPSKGRAEGPDAAQVVFLDHVDWKSVHTSVKCENVIVLTPEERDIAALTDAIRTRGDQSFQAGVIVNQARDGAEAQRVFRTLKASLCPFPGAKIEYLGHCARDEKIIQAVRKRKILLDLDSGAPSVRCFELLAKRFRSRYLEEAGVDDDRIVTRRRLQTSRFQEEPARAAPGNGTGFWRTLLGEVKA